ncbi:MULTISPECIES: DMT family transporter [unclassified Ochrobactrum]|uniref:DMT family transporter n=1 Tax=unclassified Ochrobactrum TaxID=239106 RepID=UPI000DD911F0|nr:DMT family transporter [Ochrobactrum sp. 3-3]MBQ0709709.1 DMT family transporter [Ochrobactrum sp. AP1BH01-1]
MNAHMSAPVEAAHLESNPMLGIGLKIASVAVFVAMSTLLKAADGVPVGQLIFFRSFFAIFAILLYLAWRGQLSGVFRTRNGFSHFWRGLVGVCSMSMSFFALTKLPLPEAIAINYASPLITVILGAVILHEVVRFYRWSAVLIGLGGVMVIIWPRLTVFSGGGMGHEEATGALAALGAAIMSAVAMMLVRRLVQTERTSTIVIYFSISASVISLASFPFGWIVPDWPQIAMLVGAGFAGGVGQILLTECYRHAPMSTIAPFEYTSMLLGLAIGFLLFGDIPTFEMLIGSAVVMAAGGFIIYREHKLAIAPHKVNAPQTQ